MRRLCLLAVLGCLCVPAVARAELVFFATGRSLSVRGHRVADGRLVLDLRSGGQVECDPSLVTSIAPDEVPYPEPEGAVAEAAPAPVAASGPTVTAPASSEPDRHAFDPIITRAAAAHGVDARLVRAVIQVESAYNQRATSPKGAIGLMQLMPTTARLYTTADPYDPAVNIDAGIRHLKMLLERFPRPLALAAYNAGEAAVERFQGIPPFAETRTYVRRVLQLAGR